MPDDNKPVITKHPEPVESVERETSGFERELSNNITDAWTEIIRDTIVDGNTDVNIDPELIKEHGAALFAALTQSLLGSIPTEELKVTIPTGVKATDDKAAKDVTLNLDIGAMLAKLMVPKDDKDDKDDG